MSRNNPYHNIQFIKSAVKLEQLPEDEGAEVAFIGRSNAGKSSALNSITEIKGLARVSKTPGRTQAINLFRLDAAKRLVDLPGYGYAKAPLTVQQRWAESVNVYLASRQCLRGLVVVMDIRHPLKEQDQALLNWTKQCHLAVHILLTKADKLKTQAQNQSLAQVTRWLQTNQVDATIQLFSAMDDLGVVQARKALDQWFAVEVK